MPKKTKKPSFEQIIEDKKGSQRIGEFRKFCEKQGMNYWKVLCLKWQKDAGRKCGNHKHKKGIYKEDLECEAQMVSAITFQINFASITEKQFNEFMNNLTKIYR